MSKRQAKRKPLVETEDEEPEKTSRRKERWIPEKLPGHESHGILAVSRVQGRSKLYGTAVNPLGFIQITLSEARRSHNLGDDHYSDGNIIAEVHMSAVQFAEAITTMNHGCGTPCTIKYRHTEGFHKCEDPPDEESTASITRRQFIEDVTDKVVSMKAVKRRIAKRLESAKISKALREELMREMHELMRLFEDSAPFAMERFEENTETAAAAAKAEVAAFVSLVAEQTGMAELRARDEDHTRTLDANCSDPE